MPTVRQQAVLEGDGPIQRPNFAGRIPRGSVQQTLGLDILTYEMLADRAEYICARYLPATARSWTEVPEWKQ